MVWFVSRYDIMHQHINHRDAWPPILRAINACKTHRYVAIIEGIKIVLWRGFRETIKRTDCLGTVKDPSVVRKRRFLSAEKDPYLLLRFCDTHTYYLYIRVYLLCIAAAPHLTFSLHRITIIFEINNNVIIFTLQKIISHARRTQEIFVA
jgi:hypothetical protein